MGARLSTCHARAEYRAPGYTIDRTPERVPFRPRGLDVTIHRGPISILPGPQ